jgi:hypothetical protein
MILLGRLAALALFPLALAFFTSGRASAEAMPDAAPSPAAAAASPSPAPTDPPVGPKFSANDPCTSINAVTTRPTVTTATCTVRPGHAILELGYQNQSNIGAGNAVQYPQTTIRIGLNAPRFELGFQPPQYERLSGGGPTQSGVTDATVAVKYLVGYTNVASYSTFVQASIPTGDAAFTSVGSNLEAGINGIINLSPALSFNGTLAGIAATNGATHYGSFVPSIYANLVLPASFPLAVLFEGAAFTHATGPSSPTRFQYIGAFTVAASNNVQFDVDYGFSPTAATGKYRYVGFGASFYH